MQIFQEKLSGHSPRTLSIAAAGQSHRRTSDGTAVMRMSLTFAAKAFVQLTTYN